MKSLKVLPEIWIVVVAILLVVLMVSVAKAEGLFFPKGFTPNLLSLYDLGATKAWWEGLALPVVGVKDYVYLEFGALTVIEKTTPEVGVSFNVPKILSLLPGVKLEITGLVTIGYGIARNIRDKVTMHGVTIRKSW